MPQTPRGRGATRTRIFDTPVVNRTADISDPITGAGSYAEAFGASLLDNTIFTSEASRPDLQPGKAVEEFMRSDVATEVPATPPPPAYWKRLVGFVV
jgi:hypothetical protein